MRVYLSSVLECEIPFEEKLKLCSNSYVLHSFAYYKPQIKDLMSACKDVLIDSGAFTLMARSIRNGNNANFDIKAYCKKYAEFVRDNKIENFIELDVEGAYGFETYKYCLYMLQDITGKDPIYVFHRWRGLDYFKELVKKKNYICLGDVDVVTRNLTQEKYFPWFVEEAHKNNCKVHGLAFTQMDKLKHIPFDSIDSSSWTAGARFANVSRFDGHTVIGYSCKRTESRSLPCSTDCKRHDLPEWIKLQRYFDTQMEPIW